MAAAHDIGNGKTFCAMSSVKMLGFNPLIIIPKSILATERYGADFDGDELNVYQANSLDVKNELEQLKQLDLDIKSNKSLPFVRELTVYFIKGSIASGKSTLAENLTGLKMPAPLLKTDKINDKIIANYVCQGPIVLIEQDLLAGNKKYFESAFNFALARPETRELFAIKNYENKTIHQMFSMCEKFVKANPNVQIRVIPIELLGDDNVRLERLMTRNKSKDMFSTFDETVDIKHFWEAAVRSKSPEVTNGFRQFPGYIGIDTDGLSKQEVCNFTKKAIEENLTKFVVVSNSPLI